MDFLDTHLDKIPLLYVFYLSQLHIEDLEGMQYSLVKSLPQRLEENLCDSYFPPSGVSQSTGIENNFLFSGDSDESVFFKLKFP